MKCWLCNNLLEAGATWCPECSSDQEGEDDVAESDKMIWKFPLRIQDEQLVEMPEGAEILSVQMQNDVPCAWALVDPIAARDQVKILCRGTGPPVNGATADRFIGTIQAGPFVFHFFRG